MGRKQKERREKKLEASRAEIAAWRKRQYEKWAPYARLTVIFFSIISIALITILSVHLITGYLRGQVITGPWGSISKSELKQNRFATITTNYGTLKVELLYKNAPK